MDATKSIIGKYLALFSATIFWLLMFCITDHGPHTGARKTTSGCCSRMMSRTICLPLGRTWVAQDAVSINDMLIHTNPEFRRDSDSLLHVANATQVNPFHTVGVYHYETSSTKSYTATYGNLMKLFLTDSITGDANSTAGHEPHVFDSSAATEDFRIGRQIRPTCSQAPQKPAHLLIEAALNFKTERGVETDPFYGVLDCIVTHVFHWSKTKEMTQAKDNFWSDHSADTDNQDDPQDLEHHDYSVAFAERCKLMTNKIVRLGENDTASTAGQC